MIDGKPTDDLLKIRQIQKGALDFVKRAAEDSLLQALKCKPDDYYYGIYKTGTDPEMNDLSLFGDIQFYDEGITRKLAAPESVVTYATNPKKLKNDFLQCRWKTGFLKRIMKIKLPYQSIYLRLKSMG